MQRKRFGFPLSFQKTSWKVEYPILGEKIYPCNKLICIDYDKKNNGMKKGAGYRTHIPDETCPKKEDVH